MLPDTSPLVPQPFRRSTVVAVKRDLDQWSWILDPLAARYNVVRFSNTERCLRRVAAEPVSLVILDADLSSRELFRAIRARHQSVPILCVTDGSYPGDLVEARAREYQFHTFALGETPHSLLEVVESLVSPREHRRVGARQCILELPTESGSYAEFPLGDISNYGCSFEARLDPNGSPFVPDALFSDIRIRDGADIVLSGVGARVKNVRPLGSEPPGAPPRFRVGMLFSGESNDARPRRGVAEIVDQEIDILALLTNALSRSAWHVNLPFRETQGIYCRPLQIDAQARCASLEAGSTVSFAPGDVVTISMEIGGVRYTFLASVTDGISSHEGRTVFGVRLPTAVKAETQRSSMRYRPADGQVELTFQSPFSRREIKTKIIDITARGAGFIVDDRDCVCPVGTILDRVTMQFSDGVEWHGRARVMSIRPSEDRQGGVRCGVEFEIRQPNEQHKFVERLTKATRPRVGAAADVSADDLWQFFSDSGFLYPEKMESLTPDAARETLARVLAAPPSLTHSFVYWTRDKELGAHMSAIKVYPRTWELQHLAGRHNASVSLMVPELILGVSEYMEQIDDIDWCRMFFRPNNGWPAYAIGDYVARLGTERSADISQYAYMIRDTADPDRLSGPQPIELREYAEEDAPHIADHFMARGKSILMQSLQLSPDEIGLRTLNEEYGQVGLTRRRELAVAVDGGGFRGFSLMEFSSMGLNLSELTSSFTLNCPEGDTEALRELAYGAVRRYRSAGHRSAICLADDWQVDALSRIGFLRTKDYTCVTWPRTFYRRFHQHAERKFVR